MGKKKRQSEPNMDEENNDSTESCDENQNATSCNHIAKGVDFPKLRKSVKNGLCTECPECEKDPVQNGILEDDYEYDLSLWLCLKCGNQACGRSRKEHALNHSKKPSSDCHALCVNTTVWSIWCYDCDTKINRNSKKKLLEVVDWLKKLKNTSVSTKPIPLGYYNVEMDNTCQPNTEIPQVRGLRNLGNTCFFNALIQCMAQTPFLIPILSEMSERGEMFELPGGKIVIDSTATDLPPLSGTLTQWGPITEELHGTLLNMTQGTLKRLCPLSLLNKVVQPKFGIGEQHDAHELMRHLLEAVRTEDLKRYRHVILEKFNLTKANDTDSNTKQILKFYDNQVSDLKIRTDQIFRGVLVSTLQCQECMHTSDREEFFLDLNLSVSTDKQKPPIMRHKSEEMQQVPEKPSKYQLKKEKRAAKKAMKRQQKSTSTSTGEVMISEELPAENKSESEESDADVEDNVEENKNPVMMVLDFEVPVVKGLESGYNSEKVSDASPELNALEMDSGVMSPLTVNVPSPGAMAVDSPSPGSSETNISLPIQMATASPEDYERPISRLSFTEKSALDDDKQLDGESNCRMRTMGGSCRWSGTLNKCQYDDGECSIQSCLNQFTACEIMTGNNKVGCENCTKNINGEGGKTVYTIATKQFLIASPPAVLILHLKRFQVSGCFTKKLSKDVSFPLILDMAPFCSDKCRDLPSIDEQQSNLLYALYGVVEHSGTMHAGHYIAYVKARPALSPDNYRWKFLSKPNVKSEKIPCGEGAQGEPTPPPGKWYCVSDLCVVEVPESQVLKAQAYLLFYERIL